MSNCKQRDQGPTVRGHFGVARSRAALGLLGALVLVSSSAMAAQPLAVFIEGGRSYATDNRESEAESRRADAGADVALGRILPGVGVGASYIHHQRESVIALPGGNELTLQPRNQLEATARLRVPLLDLPGYYGARAARNQAKASRAGIRASRVSVDREVAAAYFEYAAAGALDTSAGKSVQTAAENLRFVEDLLAAGRTTDLERERAVANLERARQDQADAQLAISVSARRLQTLSGVTPTAPTAPPVDDLRKEAPLSYFSSRVQSTSAWAVSQASIAAARDAHAASRARLLPTLTGVAQERLSWPAGAGGEHDNYALLLLLDFSLDYAVLSQRQVQAAELDLRLTQGEGVRRRVSDQIHDTYRQVETLIVKAQAARAQAKAAARAAELAAARFEAGKATQLDVTQAQRDAFLADASRIAADASLAFARVALRLAAALPLPPSTSTP